MIWNKLYEYNNWLQNLHKKSNDNKNINETEKLISLIAIFCHTKPGDSQCLTDQFEERCRNYYNTNETASLQILKYNWDIYLSEFNTIKDLIFEFKTKINQVEHEENLFKVNCFFIC